jgi:hypothetical protein
MRFIQRFLLRELHYQLGLSMRLGYPEACEYSACEEKIIETEKVLNAQISSIRKA